MTRTTARSLCSLTVGLFGAGPATGDAPAADEPPSGGHAPAPVATHRGGPADQAVLAADGEPAWAWERLAGDWGGVRAGLGDRGVSVDAEYLVEYTGTLVGGVNEGQGSFRDLLTVGLEIDTEALAGLPGGVFFAQYLHVTAEEGGSLDAGDIQVFSNIENDASLDVLYELWYEQRLLGDRVRLKLGKVDANAEFNVVDVAGDFSSSSAGFSPTIFVFPSYPDPATSVNVFVTAVEHDRFDLTLGYGFYDGAAGADGIATGRRGPSTFFSNGLSDDYLHVFQAELAWDELFTGTPLLKDGRVSVGGWYHSGVFERFDGGTDDGAFGMFVTGEVRLFDPDRARSAGEPQETAAGPLGTGVGDAPARGLYVFAQYGWADDAVSEFGRHVAGGVVWRGPRASRPDDSMGLYVSFVDLSDEPGAGLARNETAIDAYYRLQLTPAVFLQPELHYIVNPSGNPSIDDVLVGSLRAGFAF